MSDQHSRIYWGVRNDERFVGIYCDDHHFATYVRLLIAAEGVWPASADMPASARRLSVKALVAKGIIELEDGGLFRVHGLDAERERRASKARAAAQARWNARNADASG